MSNSAAEVRLTLITDAETSGIEKGVGALQRLKSFVETASGGLLKLHTVVEGLAVAFEGWAVAKGVEKSIENAAELREAAIRAGQSVEQLSALTGGKAGPAADAMAKGMKFLSEWMLKSGQAGRDLNQVFIEQADLISKTTDGDERLRLATERFGRSGTELLPVLMKGREGLERQMESARAFGLVISTEFAHQAHEFEVNLKRINQFGQGIFNSLAEAVLPTLLEITDPIAQTLKSYSAQIRGFIQDMVGATITAWKEGRFGEFLTLVTQVGIEEGLRLGFQGALAGMKLGLQQLFSVDFLILSATAGRILVNALLQAVRIPVDVLQASFEWLFDHVYNLWVGLVNKVAPMIATAFQDEFNRLVGFLNKIKIFGDFAEMKFTVAPEVSIEQKGFAELFADAQGRSAEATKTITDYLDQQIQQTKEILTLGQITDEQNQKLVTAKERLIELLKKEEEIRSHRTHEEAAKPEHQTSKADLDEQRKQLEFQIQSKELEVQQLHLRGQSLEASGRIVGSIQQEAGAIKATLLEMEKLAKQRQQVTDDMEARGFLTSDEARKQELKDAQELLRIQGQLLQLKEQTNDFTFFEKLKRNLQDLSDQFKHVGASIADVLSKGIKGAIDTVSTGIWGIIDGTQTWGDLFRQIGRSIISDLIKIALQEILLDNLKKGIMMAWKGLVSLFRTADVAEHNATEAAKTPALAANATLASVESYGVAVAIGVAAIAAILASVGAFAEGGIVQGGEQFIRVNEQGREAVLNARATALLGPDMINSLNAGVATFPDAPRGGGGNSGSAQQSASSSGSTNHQFLFVDSRNSQAAREFMESTAGRALIVEIVRNSKTEIGIR